MYNVVALSVEYISVIYIIKFSVALTYFEIALCRTLAMNWKPKFSSNVDTSLVNSLFSYEHVDTSTVENLI